MPLIDPKNVLGNLPEAVQQQPQGPQITAITPSKRNNERLHIYLNGQYAMTLSMMVIAQARLKVGEPLPAERVAELQVAEHFNKLYDRALTFLGPRPRSEYEVISKLKEVERKASQPKPVKKYSSFRKSSSKRGFGNKYSKPAEAEPELEEEELDELPLEEDLEPEEELAPDDQTIERVLVKLREQALVDDLAFARFWLGNRQQFRPSGVRLLKMELRQKHLADEVIEQALAEYTAEQDAEQQRNRELAATSAALNRRPLAAGEEASDEDEEGDAFDSDATPDQEAALGAARKKLRTYAGLDRQTFKRRMGGFLQRRGYSFGTVSYVTNTLWDELNS